MANACSCEVAVDLKAEYAGMSTMQVCQRCICCSQLCNAVIQACTVDCCYCAMTFIHLSSPLSGKMLPREQIWDETLQLPHVLPCKQLPSLLVCRITNRLAHTHRPHSWLYTGTSTRLLIHRPHCCLYTGTSTMRSWMHSCAMSAATQGLVSLS